MSRVLLITGASSGIGKATALGAAEAGDHLVLLARAPGPLEDTALECEKAGAASVMVLPTDVGDDDAVASAFLAIDRRHGQIDAVVHSAGVVSYGRTEEVPREVFEGVLRTNLFGSVNVARHSVTRMRQQGHGNLVLIGSVIGHLAVPTMTPYTVSKWGVRALARQLKLENQDIADLHISYVAPGGVDTPIYGRSADYTGKPGSPPPPVASAEHVGRVILKRLDDPKPHTQTGLLNGAMRFGFTAMPWAFDRLIGPMFAILATDRKGHKEPTTGNVLHPIEEDAVDEESR